MAVSFSLPFAPSVNGALRRVPIWVVWIAGVLPLGWIVWLLFTGGLGVDPVKEIEHRLGKIGLQLIVAGLLVTPLRRWGGLNLLRFRRAIGVAAFAYVSLHLLAWLVLDMALFWQQALGDIAKRPYLTAGMAAFALLLPLAVTSNNWSLRRLGGARWRRLHQLVYPAALLGAVHYLWLVKAWPVEPFVYLGAILALLALRLWR
ncbi:protein-methionine-sulfoxide reductase heme-binding subunit MsrQ [Phaeovulum sp.]|uniref:protein-methionine-sulfoxide reductase heme-binding subunit MsrQ n=1 Tax=Phaeovulum sp. TaxID=2934796 RepID=UPI00356525C5